MTYVHPTDTHKLSLLGTQIKHQELLEDRDNFHTAAFPGGDPSSSPERTKPRGNSYERSVNFAKG